MICAQTPASAAVMATIGIAWTSRIENTEQGTAHAQPTHASAFQRCDSLPILQAGRRIGDHHRANGKRGAYPCIAAIARHQRNFNLSRAAAIGNEQCRATPDREHRTDRHQPGAGLGRPGNLHVDPEPVAERAPWPGRRDGPGSERGCIRSCRRRSPHDRHRSRMLPGGGGARAGVG